LSVIVQFLLHTRKPIQTFEKKGDSWLQNHDL